MITLNRTPRKLLLTLFALTIPACFTMQGRSQQAGNLIQDPGFESASSLEPYWGATGTPTSAGIDTNAAHAHSGNHSAFIYDDYGSGKFVALVQTVKVVANTTYTLNGYIDAYDTTDGLFGIHTPGGATLASTSFINTDPGPFTHGGSDYQPYKVNFNSGGNTSLVVVAGYTTSGKASFINLDDVSLVGAQTQSSPAPTTLQGVFNCSSFASSGTCGALDYSGQKFFLVNGGGKPTLSGSRVNLIPSGTTHAVSAINYQTPVNVQAFTANFTFVPNGQNVAFVLQNSNNNEYFNGPAFSSGAGCEAGFYQAFQAAPPNHIFALELDSWSYLGSIQSFSYSSVQIYQSGQSPCNPNDSGPDFYLTDKISTSPVPLNSPAASQGTSTGDIYSATVKYSGTTLTLNMYDVTAGGACPGARCFTHTWDVNIPSWVGADTAYVGLTAATGEESRYPLYIDSFSYTQ